MTTPESALRSAPAERLVTPEPSGIEDRTLLLGNHEVGLDDPIYWPSVVPVHDILAPAARLGAYYLYYSASHHDNAAIRLAYADDPLGPYVDHGPVFRDESGGPHTETPEVVWNADSGRFHLYYHAFIGASGQTTGLAFSEDGLDWTKHGPVIEGYPTTPGNRHTGYTRIHRFGNLWIAHHLMGGGGSSGFGVSYSTDGISWTTDPRRLTNGSDLTGSPNRRIAWSHTRIVDRGGRYRWIGTMGPITWGGNPKGKRVVHAPFVGERSIVGPPEVLAEPVEPWEGDTTYTPETLVEADTTYLFYATRGEDGGNIGGARITWTIEDAEGGSKSSGVVPSGNGGDGNAGA